MTFAADSLGLIQDIDVRLTVELGRKTMRLRDVLALGENSVIELDRLTDEPLDILVNGKLIARGEVVTQANRFAIRVVEVVGAAPPAPAPAASASAAAAGYGAADDGHGGAPIVDRRAPPPIVEHD